MKFVTQKYLVMILAIALTLTMADSGKAQTQQQAADDAKAQYLRDYTLALSWFDQDTGERDYLNYLVSDMAFWFSTQDTSLWLGTDSQIYNLWFDLAAFGVYEITQYLLVAEQRITDSVHHCDTGDDYYAQGDYSSALGQYTAADENAVAAKAALVVAAGEYTLALEAYNTALGIAELYGYSPPP